MIRPVLLSSIACALFSGFLPASGETLAYYRFEGEGEGTAIGAVRDSADKSPAKAVGNPKYSSHVPVPVVPQTQEANTGAASFPAEGRKGDIFSDPKSAINSHPFTDFTIEAWIYFDTIEGSFQTIIGRDNFTEGDNNVGKVALFYLSRTPDTAKGNEIPGTFRVEIINSDKTSIFTNSVTAAEAGTWYHVAVVGDVKRGTITVYVNGTEEGSASGYSGLYVPEGGASWTIGRGQYARKPADFVTGLVDEVRFSDAALPPSQFLCAKQQK